MQQGELFSYIKDDIWKQNIVLASVPLWKYEDERPVANASGCLVNYRGTLFLLSIAHATIAESEWRMEEHSLDYRGGQLGVFYQPVSMDSIRQFNLSPVTLDLTEPELVDFTYKKLPPTLTSTHVVAWDGINCVKAARTVFYPNFDLVPKRDKKYGFFGNVKFGGVDNNRLVFHLRLEHELTYLGKEGEYHVFLLPHKYGSHSNYEGCSGAPVIDENNNVFGLVAFGRKSTNTIHAIDIARYRAILEINA